ncbi:TetR family transcriptional regulator [Nocardia callitridis]|uniref:TetR family transcriptional regulator n=2 Tax=Nocardia callitridis TaxID=648753 RepID=A0ABP9JUK8_9NOCA
MPLRERKKVRTRRTIRTEAFRLFREQGYGETTVEQIAAAAEVSPSTFFRYFPSKEQLVITDDLDALMIAAYREQPPELSPMAAFHKASDEVFQALTEEQAAFEHERQTLLSAEPELRAAVTQQLLHTFDMVSTMIAERIDRAADDFEIRVAAGALTGAAMAVSSVSVMDSANIGRVIEFLDAGMPFGKATGRRSP